MATEFKDCIPIITVRDLSIAKDFYIGVLGFELDFEVGEPLSIVGGFKDLVAFYLVGANSENVRQPPGTANLNVLTNEVDQLFDRCRSARAEVIVEPEDRSYVRAYIDSDHACPLAVRKGPWNYWSG